MRVRICFCCCKAEFSTLCARSHGELEKYLQLFLDSNSFQEYEMFVQELMKVTTEGSVAVGLHVGTKDVCEVHLCST